MRRFFERKIALAILCAALFALLSVAPAWGASSNPLFVFVPTPPAPPNPPKPPPVGYFNGPCGIGVDSSGRFYVSDYYHDAVDIFSPPATPFTSPPGYGGQLTYSEPLDGPCALAFDSSNDAYVNTYHRNVVSGIGTPIAGVGVDETHPTGVAVDPNTGRIYVDERTYVGVYEASGAPVEEGGQPLRIGQGTLEEGYGLAISRFASTAGYLYVPDATSKTVKVYDPAAADKEDPVQTIPGPTGGFTSLREAAVAVDWSTGNVYVADDLQPSFTEEPQAQIDVFGPTGAYLGVLKYRVVDALPPGLAVDNSGFASQGRVYVTSGNSVQAGVYAYGPGAQIAASQSPSVGLTVGTSGEGGGTIASDLGQLDCSASCEAQVRSGAEVTLTATPDPGSTFTGWSGGGCGGTGSCEVRMDEARSVEAIFQPLLGPPAPAASAPASLTPQASTPRRRHRRARRHSHHHHKHRSEQVKRKRR